MNGGVAGVSLGATEDVLVVLLLEVIIGGVVMELGLEGDEDMEENVWRVDWPP
jgi:hypothetical protein